MPQALEGQLGERLRRVSVEEALVGLELQTEAVRVIRRSVGPAEQEAVIDEAEADEESLLVLGLAVRRSIATVPVSSRITWPRFVLGRSFITTRFSTDVT